MYYDLNISCAQNISRETRTKLFKTLLDHGFNNVALNVEVTDPKDYNLTKLEAHIKSFELSKGTVQTFSRITFVLNNKMDISFVGKNIKNKNPFHIISVQPNSEMDLVKACSMDVDLITFNISERIDFMFKYNIMKEAARRGLFFELTYSESLFSEDSRRFFVENTHVLLEVIKSQHLILSSRTNNPFKLRPARDLINMTEMLGLTRKHAESLIQTNPKTILFNSFKKRFIHKSIIGFDEGSHRINDSEREDALVKTFLGTTQ